MRWDALVELGRELPEVEEGSWYRGPALLVAGKGFARLREEEGAVAFVLASVAEQQELIASRPDVYFITDHYRGHASVLARLSTLRAAEARRRLEDAWRLKASKRLRDRFDGE